MLSLFSGSKLEEDCEHNGQCKYFDENAACNGNTCVCSEQYNQVRNNGTEFCQRGKFSIVSQFTAVKQCKYCEKNVQ